MPLSNPRPVPPDPSSYDEDLNDVSLRFFQLAPAMREEEVRSLVAGHREAIDELIDIMLELIPLAARHLGETMPPDVRQRLVALLVPVNGLHELFEAISAIVGAGTMGDVEAILTSVRKLQELSEL